jgi:hypothetical protein
MCLNLDRVQTVSKKRRREEKNKKLFTALTHKTNRASRLIDSGAVVERLPLVVL